MLKSLVCAVATLLLSATAGGQSVKRYDVRAGLSENTVRSIVQDTTGYMWFGTKDGLNRFNGREFTVFGHDRDDGHGGHLNIMKVLAHRSGRGLWVATSEKLHLFDTATERFSLFDIPSTDDGTGVHGVFDLCYDRAGVLWIGTSRGLFSFDEDSGTVRLYTNDPAEVRSLPSDHVWVVFVDSAGHLWAGTRNGLALYRPSGDDFTVYSDHGTSFGKPACREVTAITETSCGSIWVGTWWGGLALFSRETGRYTYFFGEGDTRTVSRIRAIHETPHGELLIGSDDGLFRFDPATGRCEPEGHGLAGESIYSFCRDREGGLWIGSYFVGVTYISPKAHEIEWYSDTRAGTEPGTPRPNEKIPRPGFGGNAVSQFCEEPGGNIWIATENGGLNYFDRAAGTFVNYPGRGGPGDVSYHNIHALLADGPKLWIGTFSRGLDVMDLPTGRVRNYRATGRPGGLPNDHIYSLYKSGDGVLYVGTLSGLCVYEPSTDSFRTVDRLAHTFVYDMAGDADGRLWFACQRDGVWRYDPARDEFVNYRHIPGDSTSLPGNWVIRACTDERGRLWFGTEGSGMCRYDPATDRFVNYTDLPGSVVYGILDDGDGHLWLSCNKGLIKYDTISRTADIYTYEDGLQSNQFNFRSSMKASDGKMFFGGVNGFNAFYPGDITRNPVPPTVTIPYVYIPDPASDTGRKTKVIPDEGRVTIGHRVRSFDVLFESLSYVAPGKNRYEYRIDPLHDRWIGTASPLVSLLNLPVGSHTLRVRSTNNDGIPSHNEATLAITVLPPPWWSPTAKTLYVVLLLTAAFLALRAWDIRNRRRRERALGEMEQRSREELLQSKLVFFTHVAHEIKTPLSLISAPLESVMATGPWDGETASNLSLIRRNTDRLLELVRQLLDLRRIDSTGYKLTLAEVDPYAVVCEVAGRFSPAATGGIRVGVVREGDTAGFTLDREALTKIVSNLLGNAVRYASSEVTVTVEGLADGEPRLLRLTVADDGPGIDRDEAARLFEPFYRSAGDAAVPVHGKKSSGNGFGQGFGIGLSLVKLLVEKHGGRVWFDTSARSGCRITVEIADRPRRTEPANSGGSQTLPEEPSDRPPGNPVLLIVEDTAEMLDFLTRNFRQSYTVVTATDGAAALAELERHPVDIILSDIAMPGTDGIALLKAVRANHLTSHIPFVLLTARGSVESKIEGLDSGADAYVEKPFSLAHLRATLASLLDNRRKLFERFASSPGLRYERLGLPGGDARWLERLDTVIRDNMTSDDFSVEVLAASMAVSRSNLQRKLKGLTGQSPNDYIRLMRLKTAADLLAGGNYRINEVCYLTGFNNLSYFTRCFQKQFGTLPREFAKKSARKNDTGTPEKG